MRLDDPPYLWLSHPVGGGEGVWEEFHVDHLLVNSYEILQSPRWSGKVRSQGIHRALGYRGKIMMDSGGFLFRNRRAIAVRPEEIIELYRAGKPDIAVVLDHPIGPFVNATEERRRQRKTLDNTRQMLSLAREQSINLIPVVHGSSVSSVTWFVDQLNRIGKFDTVGIGSLMPSMYSSRGARGLRETIAVLRTVRELLPDSRLHAFGVGSTRTMHLMFLLGIDSVDSSSWRTKAAFGAIQLAGVGDRYVTRVRRHFVARKMSPTEVAVLSRCRCPRCRRFGYSGLETSFRSRAIHNAWVLQREVKKIRELMRRGSYDQYAERLLTGSRYGPALGFVGSNK